MTRFQFSGELFPNERRMLDAVAEAWLADAPDEALRDFSDDELAAGLLESEWADDETWDRDGLAAAFARAREKNQ